MIPLMSPEVVSRVSRAVRRLERRMGAARHAGDGQRGQSFSFPGAQSSGDGCTEPCMCLTILFYTLTDGKDGKLYVMWGFF